MAAVIGLDIGTSAVRAVQIRPGRRGPSTLERVGQVLLPAGAVRDGEILEGDVVADALHTLWKTFGFKSRRVALGLANQQVVVRQVDLPYLPEPELRKSLSFQVQDHLPIPIEQAVLDFHLLENVELSDGQQMSRILLVAAHKDMVNQLLDVIRQARLTPVGLDLDAFAVLRALASPELLPTGEAELLLDIGASVTNLVVHDGGSPRFVRILLMGGGGITESLVSALGVSAQEAEEAKSAMGIVDDQIQRLEDPQAGLIAERAWRFVDEIRGSVDYYAAQQNSVPITRAVLAGGASLLPNLRERLADTLRIPVEYGRPLQHLKIGKVGVSEDDLLDAEPFLTDAVGLALGASS